jgi:hypothetical protein
MMYHTRGNIAPCPAEILAAMNLPRAITLLLPAVLAGPAAAGRLLVVHAPALAPAAAAWAEYRAVRGWEVVTFAAPPAGDAAACRAQVRARIREFAQGAGPRAVLLLGDSDAVPAWTFPQLDATLRDPRDADYATDHPYQVFEDGDPVPRIALGRVPARSGAEAAAVLAKVRQYEESPALGPWRRRITYAAGEGRFGMADALLESLFRTMVERLVPDAYDVSMTYAKPSSIYCPPPARLTDTLLARLGEGSLLFNYVGHGSEYGFDAMSWKGLTVPMLEVADLARLANRTPGLPLALLTCCSAGWYDLAGDERSLAEAMLFHPAGPVAIIAGSRPTHPYANVVLQKEFTRLLLTGSGGPATVGELDLAAMQQAILVDPEDGQLDAIAAPIALAMRWPTSLGGLRRMHVQLYNLLDDPALRLDLPRRSVGGIALADGRLEGRVESMRRGRVLVTVESPRTSPARSEALLAVTGEDDPDLDAKAAHNYPIANDVVLLRLTGEVAGGRFEVPLGEMPPGARLVKVYAAGEDDEGRAFDAIGAERLAAAPP